MELTQQGEMPIEMLRIDLTVHGGEDAQDALRRISLSKKETPISGIFCEKWPMKIKASLTSSPPCRQIPYLDPTHTCLMALLCKNWLFCVKEPRNSNPVDKFVILTLHIRALWLFCAKIGSFVQKNPAVKTWKKPYNSYPNTNSLLTHMNTYPQRLRVRVSFSIPKKN